MASGRDDASLLQTRQVHQVVRDHLQFDHRPCSRQSDRSDGLAAHLGQARKRMLAERTLAGDSAVASLLRRTQWPIGLALALDAVAITLLAQRDLASHFGVAAVGIDVPARVRFIHDRLEHRRVVHRGRRDLQTADEAPAPIRVRMQLVAVVALAMLLRPACIDILLSPLRAAPVFRRLALRDRLVLPTSPRL